MLCFSRNPKLLKLNLLVFLPTFTLVMVSYMCLTLTNTQQAKGHDGRLTGMQQDLNRQPLDDWTTCCSFRDKHVWKKDVGV